MTILDPVERHLFLEGIFLRYGYDFRRYSEASLDRRLKTLVDQFQTNNLLDVLKKALESSDSFRAMLPVLTISTTEFFRDPLFFASLRTHVFPVLKTYSRLVIWVGGCSSGEEVLSLAIALKEEGLLHRSTIHATDINPAALKTAKEGIYELSTMSFFNRNYVLAGGLNSPSEYYTAEYGLARFDPSLLANVVFSEHNLVTDAPFVEAHLILCRNVFIYFNRELQDRIAHLFAQSLIFRGFLGIGSKESLRFSSIGGLFENTDERQNIYALKAQLISNDLAAPVKGLARKLF